MVFETLEMLFALTQLINQNTSLHLFNHGINREVNYDMGQVVFRPFSCLAPPPPPSPPPPPPYTHTHTHTHKSFITTSFTAFQVAVYQDTSHRKLLYVPLVSPTKVEASWNVMAHAQKPDFVFRRNGRVHLNRRGRQFSRLLAAEVCASAVVMLDKPCSEVVWRVLATHYTRQFPLHFSSRASTCAITFELESTCSVNHYVPADLLQCSQ